MNRKELAFLAKTAYKEWRERNESTRAGALAFFIILPLPTLLIIIAGLLAMFFGPEQAVEILTRWIDLIAGPTIASLFNQLLAGTENPFTSPFNTFFSLFFTISGAIGVFMLLQDTMNRIWEIKLPSGRKLKTRIRKRFSPFLQVFFTGLIVIFVAGFASVILDFIYNALLPIMGPAFASLNSIIIEILLAFSTSTLLFAIILKKIPYIELKWHDVAWGAVISGIAFTTLNILFGWYLRTFPATSLSGATAAYVLLLLWIFVSTQFLLYGAHFSNIFCINVGSRSKKKETPPSLLIEQPIAKAEVEPQMKSIEKPKLMQTVTEEEQATFEKQVEDQLKMKTELQESSKDKGPLICIKESQNIDGTKRKYQLNVKWKTKKKPAKEQETKTKS
jgi:membrane protein